MSESEEHHNDSPLDVFTDTSVLFNFALDVRQQRADELLVDHTCSITVSGTVKREFEGVMERRQRIHEQLLPYIKRGEIEDFEPKNTDALSTNDWGYVREFRETLAELEPAEAARRVQERNRQLRQGYRQLFNFSPPLVTVAQVPSRDASLLGTLSGIIKNDADARIICDAVEWGRNDGSGIFITSDADDMLTEDSSQGQESEESDGLSDSFAGFISGDSRSTPERINGAIERRYDSNSRIEIHSINSFLENY